MSQHPLVG